MARGVRLAVEAYLMPAPVEGPGVLNLSWTIDEREFLQYDIAEVIARELSAEVDDDLPYVRHFMVDTPYGEVIAPAVSSLFDMDLPSLTCGAGVASLLHALAGLVGRGTAVIVGQTYPDFAVWVQRSGGRCVAAADESPVAALGKARQAGASVIFCERPQLGGGLLDDIEELQTLCAEATRDDRVLVVDESNANYHPIAFSAVHLTATTPNLVVLRGLSKAYGAGGLRLGYCVASSALHDRIRAAVPPLLASSLSLRLGAALLGLGDVTEPLRARVARQKPAMLAALHAAGVDGVTNAGDHLPYLFLRGDGIQERQPLEARGIFGKRHLVWAGDAAQELYRLSVPLRDERMRTLRELLGVT